MDTPTLPIPLMLFKNEASQLVDDNLPKKHLNGENKTRSDLDSTLSTYNKMLQLALQVKTEPGEQFSENPADHLYDSATVQELEFGEEKYNVHNDHRIDSDASSSSSGIPLHFRLQADCQFSQDQCIEPIIYDQGTDSDVDIETIPDSSFFSSFANHYSSSSGNDQRKWKRPAAYTHKHKPHIKQDAQTQHAANIASLRNLYHKVCPNYMTFHNYAKVTIPISPTQPACIDVEDDDRRFNRTVRERARRYRLNDLFIELCNQIPGLNKEKKQTKLLILKQAAAHIKQLENFLLIQETIISRETTRNESLRQMLQYLQLQAIPIVLLEKL